MAWDFGEEIHALAGFDAGSTDTTTTGETYRVHASQWLTDGARDVINVLSKAGQYIDLMTTSNTLSDTNGVTLTLNNAQVRNVVLYDGTRLQGCRRIQATDRGRASDINDLMNYATTSDPVYWINTGTLEIFPTPTDSNYANAETLSYPSINYNDSSISAFPDEAEHLVVLYAAIKATEYMMLAEEDQEVFAPQLATLKNDYQQGISLLVGGGAPAPTRGGR